MGASIQMAYSLGLHRDQMPESGGSMEREQNRRIWWTLFTLDQEIASRGGSPALVDERSLKTNTPLPSEQLPGPSFINLLLYKPPVYFISGNPHAIIMASYIGLIMSLK